MLGLFCGIRLRLLNTDSIVMSTTLYVINEEGCVRLCRAKRETEGSMSPSGGRVR